MTHTDLSWEGLQRQFTCPAWFADARLGFWLHWGPQSQPLLGGGWYARHAYMPDVGEQMWGKNAYRYHQETYGHQSEAGYKEVLRAWTAERLDPNGLVDYLVSLGGRYIVAMANHHDHFDNFNSTHQPWNSVNVGPHRDIIGDFAAATRRAGVPFGVSSHDDRMVMYYEHAFDADASGPYAGVPYDGRQTKEDGAGTWWEGLDPVDLYGPPPEQRTDAWVVDMQYTWELRHRELIERYRPDMLWFDGYGFPYGEHGKEVCRRFYNQSLAEQHAIRNVVVAKIPDDPAVVDDIERGVPDDILPCPWQSITTFTGWFYKEDSPPSQDARTLVETLCDVISKNGNLLVNVEPYGDGSLPPLQKAELDAFGAWVHVHAPAIFASRPWTVFGDNLTAARPTSTPDHADAGAHFNERTADSPPYAPDEVRFTTHAGRLYVMVLNPVPGPLRLPSLGLASTVRPGRASSLGMLGDPGRAISWDQDDHALTIHVPDHRPTGYACVFEIDGALG